MLTALTELPEEIWRPVIGFEGLYEVSSLGKVKSLERTAYPRTNLVPEKILKLNKKSNGYLQIALCKDHKYSYKSVHRLVAEAFIPNPDNLPCVNHINCDREDNRLENLEWCSYSKNNTLPYEQGRRPRLNNLYFNRHSYAEIKKKQRKEKELAEL